MYNPDPWLRPLVQKQHAPLVPCRKPVKDMHNGDDLPRPMPCFYPKVKRRSNSFELPRYRPKFKHVRSRSLPVQLPNAPPIVQPSNSCGLDDSTTLESLQFEPPPAPVTHNTSVAWQTPTRVSKPYRPSKKAFSSVTSTCASRSTNRRSN